MRSTIETVTIKLPGGQKVAAPALVALPAPPRAQSIGLSAEQLEAPDRRRASKRRIIGRQAG